MRFLRIVSLGAIATLASFPSRAHEVTGKITVAGRADASAKTIVYAERLDRRDPLRPRKARLAQKSKSFAPRVVAVAPTTTA